MENILQYEDIAAMRKAGKVAARFFRLLKKMIKPGISTKGVELFFNSYLKKYSAMKGAFLGYNNYPASFFKHRSDLTINGRAVKYPNFLLFAILRISLRNTW